MTPEEVVWDATACRHFAVAGRVDVLTTRHGLHVPRPVLDTSDPSGDELLSLPQSTLSEIAQAEGHFRRRFRDEPNAADYQAAERLMDLRNNPDVRVLDLTPDELDDAQMFGSDQFADRMDLLAPLGKGEAAVLAIAANRGWRAGLDDADARAVAHQLSIEVVTTQQWLYERVTSLGLGATEARHLYQRLLDGGFRGPASLPLP